MVVLIPLSIAKYHIVLIGLSKGEYVYHVSKHISTNLRQIVDGIKENKLTMANTSAERGGMHAYCTHRCYKKYLW